MCGGFALLSCYRDLEQTNVKLAWRLSPFRASLPGGLELSTSEIPRIARLMYCAVTLPRL